MPEYSFENLEEYFLINAGSHMKPPARVTPPALTWQIGLWMAKGKDSKRPTRRNREIVELPFGDSRLERKDWLDAIDKLLVRMVCANYRLWRHDDSSPPEPRQSPTVYTDDGGSITLFRHRIRSISHEYPVPSWRELVDSWEELPENEVDQYRYELFSSTFYFEGIEIKFRAGLHGEFCTLGFIAELDREAAVAPSDLREKICTSFRALDKMGGDGFQLFQKFPSGPGKVDSSKYTEYVSQWGEHSELLYDGFWKLLWQTYSPHIADTPSSAGRPALIDPIAGRRFCDFRGVVLSGTLRKNLNGNIQSSLDQPFIPKQRKDVGLSLAALTAAQATNLVDAFLPMLAAADLRSASHYAEPGRPPEITPEHAAARLLDGRAIYVSALGAGRRWRSPADTVATPPLRYLLLVPNRNRWQLGRLIDRLHLLGALRIASLKDLDKMNRASEELKSLSLFSDNTYELNKRLDRISQYGEGGLPYRVERSKYYVSSFNLLVPRLRLERIEGYQPYDEFVARRLGPTWESIRRLGDRYGRALQGADYRNQRRQAEDQVKLLQFAEVAATVPVGYYGGHILYGFATLVGAEMKNPVHVDEAVALSAWSIMAMSFYWIILLIVRLTGKLNK